MHHSAATTICKIEEGEQGEVLGWTWVIGWEAGRGKVVATGREEKVMAGQRDPWMKSSEREFEEESEEAGRERLIHWGPRTLDLDILFYDDLVLETTDLVIPHPDMQNRRFVLEPLSELTRYYEHPVLHCPIAALLASLNTVTEVEP